MSHAHASLIAGAIIIAPHLPAVFALGLGAAFIVVGALL